MKVEDSNEYVILPWDSNLFGYLVARIDSSFQGDLRLLLEEFQKKLVKLVYWSVDPNNEYVNNLAKDCHGALVDEKVTYSIDCSKIDTNLSIEGISVYAKKSISESLLSLALKSGVYSRFKKDENLIHHEYEKLYEEWIKKSVSHEVSFEVLVYEDSEAEIQGFITLEEKNGYGVIGLLAVSERFRKKSIGRSLVFQALAEFRKKGYKKVLVTTQKANEIACNFYENLGFVKETLENVYHFWLI